MSGTTTSIQQVVTVRPPDGSDRNWMLLNAATATWIRAAVRKHCETELKAKQFANGGTVELGSQVIDNGFSRVNLYGLSVKEQRELYQFKASNACDADWERRKAIASNDAGLLVGVNAELAKAGDPFRIASFGATVSGDTTIYTAVFTVVEGSKSPAASPTALSNSTNNRGPNGTDVFYGSVAEALDAYKEKKRTPGITAEQRERARDEFTRKVDRATFWSIV